MKCFAGAALAFLCVGANANLLVNGSFEVDTAFVSDGNHTMSLPAGSTAMPGWVTSVNEIAWIGTPNPFGVPNDDGNYHLDLMGYHDSQPVGMVSQTFATNIGWTYGVTFDIGRNTQMNVSAAGSSASMSHFSTTDPFWVGQTWSFTATSNLTTLSFQGGPNTHPQYAGLDNVGVEILATPEPASMAMLALGGLALIRRRRARS